MPSSFSFGKFQFDLAPGSSAAARTDGEELPWRILIAGDFTGRENRGASESLASRRPVRIDCDNAEQVFSSLAPKLKVSDSPLGSAGFSFGSLDSFHPDHLVDAVASLSELASLRKRLHNPSTAQAALREAEAALGGPFSGSTGGPAAAPSSPGESTEDALSRLMGRSSSPAPAPAKPSATGVDINSLIKNIVAPSVSPAATQEQTAAVSAVELELSQRMRAILHHPDFQRIEANWRGVDLLVREFGGEDNIELHLLDVSKAELSQDLKTNENLQQSGLWKILRDKEWAVVVGAFAFDASVADLEVLGRVAQLCAASQTVFLAGGDSGLFGCKSVVAHVHPDEWTDSLRPEVSEAWAALRKLSAAAHIGLTVPRVLLRQPYGRGSDPIESFGFEELNGEGAHSSYLWGSGAFAAALVLTEFFRNDGWEVAGSGTGEVTDLPVYKFIRDGETAVKPCAEAWLSERAGERISEHGLIPLLSVKGRGSVRLSGIRSISLEVEELALRRG